MWEGWVIINDFPCGHLCTVGQGRELRNFRCWFALSIFRRAAITLGISPYSGWHLKQPVTHWHEGSVTQWLLNSDMCRWWVVHMVLVTGTRHSDHITPVLRQLHWLPVRQRVAFKIDRGARASVARWCCSRVSCWRLSSSLWCWSSPAEVSFQRHPEADRAANTQQTWRQEFLGCRSSTVEWPSTRA